MGFVVFNLVYVVFGCLDGYWVIMINVWDIVVGMLIVIEVGVVFVVVEGEEFNFCEVDFCVVFFLMLFW